LQDAHANKMYRTKEYLAVWMIGFTEYRFKYLQKLASSGLRLPFHSISDLPYSCSDDKHLRYVHVCLSMQDTYLYDNMTAQYETG